MQYLAHQRVIMNIHQYHQRNQNPPPMREAQQQQHVVLPLRQEQPHVIPVFDDEDDDNHVARRVVVSRHCQRSNHISSNTNNTMARTFGIHHNITNHPDHGSVSNDQKPQQHPSRKQYSRLYERSLHRDASKSRNHNHLSHKEHMKDCIELFDNCYSASCQVGAAVVKREVIIVNQQLMSFRRRQEQLQHHQQQQHEELKRKVDIQNKKHQKRSLDEIEVATDHTKEEKDEESDTLTVHNTNYKNDNDNDIHTSDDGDCYQNRSMTLKKRRVSLLPKETDVGQKSNDVSDMMNFDIPNEHEEKEDEDESCDVTASSTTVTNAMVISQDERRSIWVRADRMKRLSCLFRQMQMIQKTIMNEMIESYNDDYCNDEASAYDEDDDVDNDRLNNNNDSDKKMT